MQKIINEKYRKMIEEMKPPWQKDGEIKFQQAEDQWTQWRERGFKLRFWTFLKHKLANDNKYKQWLEIYEIRAF